MNVYCLYFPNGKRYVGVERKTGSRIAGHKRSENAVKSNQVVSEAIAEHGWGNVKWRYLAAGCNNRDGVGLERFFIKTMGLQNPEIGYNIKAGDGKSNVSTISAKGVEVRVCIDARLIKELKKRTDLDSTGEVVKEAISLLYWATYQTGLGNRIMTIDKTGKMQRFDTPALANSRMNSMPQ